MDQEVYLKNVTQIGTPGPSGKIYIADDAYSRVHMDDYRDVRVFVLMGHTECSAGKYTTFIEAAITVDDIEFIRNIPVWTNKVWNRVYTEIKRAYDNMIIVGWAMDQKGVEPVAGHELESIHREHFGGANQVLLLLDSEQQDERFYLSRNNHLYPKDGFYIYYSCGRKKDSQHTQVNLEIPPETKIPANYAGSNRRRNYSQKDNVGSGVDTAEQKSVSMQHDDMSGRTATRGQYRAMIAAQQKRRRSKSAGKFNAAAAAITVALIAGIAVTGFRKDPMRAAQMDAWIETISGGVWGSSADQESDGESEHIIYFSTEEDGASEGTQDGEANSEEGSATESGMTDSTESSSAESGDSAGSSTEGNGAADAAEDTQAQKTSGDVIPVEEVDGGI